jgi:hypothetical protein
MRKTAGYTHFWTVRGQGFDDKQWRAILGFASGIIDKAREAGVKVAGPDGTGNPELGAQAISLNGGTGEMGESFTLVKRWQASAFGECETLHQPYDAVVISILTAAKKVAPDILEITSDGGSDVFTRIFAMTTQNLFTKTVKLAAQNPSLRPKLIPLMVRHASVTKVAERRFLVAYAHRVPEFQDELVRRLYAARGITALEFATPAALKQYLKDHPKADPSIHSVKKKKEDAANKEKDSEKNQKPGSGAAAAKNLGEGVVSSQVHGNAVVHGDAMVEDKAEVGGHAVVYGKAKVRGKAKVGGDSEVSGTAQIAGSAEITSATVSDKARVGGKAKINGGKISGDAAITGGTWEDSEVAHGQWNNPKGPKAVEKNGLKDADVDEVLTKIVNKKGRTLSPAELFAKFMREAKPETKERMKDMSIGEFMDVVKFMSSDEEVDTAMGGKKASMTTKAKFTEAQLRSATIRVAYATKDPDLRRKLAKILKATEEENEKEGKFEKGKPADPTENMSPEDAAEWKRQNKDHADEFKTAGRKG